jgi:phytoene dehydrogenase-like protein
MKRRVIVVGAGMGGLTAAIRLAQRDYEVTVFEARPQAGGLASRYSVDGFEFDAGPYILLDKPGLQWVFAQFGLFLDDQIEFRRVSEVYDVTAPDRPSVQIHDSLDETIAALELHWPRSGDGYHKFIRAAWQTYQRLQPLQHISIVTPLTLLRTGAWRAAPILFRSLESVLQHTGLPETVLNALGIWTHVAGQTRATAPSPLALVPALIHHIGAWYPTRGIGAIPEKLTEIALQLGVKFHFESRVASILCNSSGASGIEIEGERIAAAAVVADAHGVGTYLQLLKYEDRALSSGDRQRLQDLPLQSPGVCAYLAVKGDARPPYLRFHLPGAGELCRLLVTPSALDNPEHQSAEQWKPARLIAPMRHDIAESGGVDAQKEFLARILAEEWWQQHFIEHRVLATRLPCEWGREFHLYRNSMNPTMTSQFMRAGRLAHRSPYVKGLYLVGSSTHPGQWVSFCAISGILAADCLQKDFH